MRRVHLGLVMAALAAVVALCGPPAALAAPPSATTRPATTPATPKPPTTSPATPKPSTAPPATPKPPTTAPPTTTPVTTTPPATTPGADTTPGAATTPGATTTPTTTTPVATTPATTTVTTPATTTTPGYTGGINVTGGTSSKPIPAPPLASGYTAPTPEPTAPPVTSTQAGPYTTGAPPEQALATDGQDDRYLMDGTWLYAPDPGDVGISQGWYQPTTSTSNWTPVAVPNSFNAGDLSTASFYGSVGWYRRDFTLPQGAFPSYVPASAQSWVIQFESVNYNATVWLNGHELGSHGGANLPFEFTLNDLQPGVNTLVVRVSDSLTANDFPPRNPGGGWWNFGGILDGVYLIPVAEAEIQDMTIRTPVDQTTGKATVQEQVSIKNLSAQPQSVALTGMYGGAKLNFGSDTIPPGSVWEASASVAVAHPRLWSPGSPNLYVASLTLEDLQGRPLTGYTYQSGIRTITVSNGLLYLNGHQLSLRGVNVHEQTTTTGAALSVAQQAQLISWVQELGATIIRAHYPLDPELEQMADEDGILLWSEVPVYHPGNEQLASPTWQASAVSLVQDNIEANQDHPSILLWSVGNELGSPPQPGQSDYIAQAAAAVHEIDPTRPAAIAITDWPGLPCESEYKPLDVIGVNEYFDWFDSGGGTTDDRNQLSPFLDSARKCYPDEAIMVSEFGFGGDRDGPVEVRGTYEFQSNSIQYDLGVMASKSWLAGAMYFPLQDFAASPGFDGSDPLGTAPYVDKGVLDQFGNPKPAFQVMQQIYTQTPQVASAVTPLLRHVASNP